MTLNKPKNENYAAVVVEIKTLLPLAGCDNVQAAIIMGNQVIVGKDIELGTVGLYFPLETQLSEPYLKNNNLYRKPELNLDQTKKGYFEENGRIRCVKFRGHNSEGLFMPLDSLIFTGDWQGLKIGNEFDEINGIEICKKYISKKSRTPGLPGSKQPKKPRVSKIIDSQFRFHQETSMLYKNVHRINPGDIISISYKMHGTSGISSYVLCKQPMSLSTRVVLWISQKIVQPVINLFGAGVEFNPDNIGYDYIYSSRKVVKNEELNPNPEHFYNVDIWGLADQQLREFLQKGMTFYYEIVGFLPNGSKIQGNYDYGQEPGTFKIYIYRITYTNIDGKVFEFSAKQVQDFCRKNGLNAVPELYYGYASELYPNLPIDYDELDIWRTNFLTCIKEEFNEKDCFMCKNKVPEEGCVVRVEGMEFEAYKAKSNAFYALETKLLDKGETNLEDEN
jgi:hypothetical protein